MRAIGLALLAVFALAGCGTQAETGGAAAQAAPVGATDAMVAAQQEALRLNPKNATALDDLAGAYLQKAREVGDPGYYAKADGLLQQALALKTDDADATTLMGTLQLARHQFLSALDWGTRARQLNPDSANALGVLVDANVELGRYDTAAAAAQAMVDLRPDLSSYARVSYQRELHGDVAGAVDAMQMAIAAGGPVPENTAYTQVLLGNLYFGSGRLRDAESAYAGAAGADPGYVQALAGLAQTAAAEGRFQDAIKLYRRAIETYPAPQFVIALGDVYTASGDALEAGRTYDLAAAEQQLYQAAGVDLDAELALFAADHGRDLPTALAAARRAVRDRPGIYSYDALAWALYKSGDLAGALAASLESHRLGTRDALLFFHTGEIEAALGRRAAALSDLQTALAINPHFSVLHAAEARDLAAHLEAST